MSFKNIFSQKIIFFGFLLASLIVYFSEASSYWVCSSDYYCANLLRASLQPLLFVLIPGTLVALLLMLFRKEIFQSWFYFFVTWSVLYLFVLYVSPNNNGGYIGASSRSIYSVLGLYIFGFGSLVIILAKAFVVYRKKK